MQVLHRSPAGVATTEVMIELFKGTHRDTFRVVRMNAGIDSDPLTGRLVRLRELREEDLTELVAWWTDQTVAVTQVTGPTHPRPAPALADMFRGWSRNDGADIGLSVTSRKNGRLVGHIGLHGTTVKDRCATLAVLIGSEHQNRGYGTDAVQTIVRYAFVELGLHRVELGVSGFNERGIAAYRKAGFVEEGRRREAVYRSGAWYDDVLMGQLRTDWEAANRTLSS